MRCPACVIGDHRAIQSDRQHQRIEQLFDPGVSILPAGKDMTVYTVEVGPRFFETFGTPLVSGRPIGPRDTPACSSGGRGERDFRPRVSAQPESDWPSFQPGRSVQAARRGDRGRCGGLEVLRVERETEAHGVLFRMAVRRAGTLCGGTADPDFPRRHRESPPRCGKPSIKSTAVCRSSMSQLCANTSTVHYTRNG